MKGHTMSIKTAIREFAVSTAPAGEKVRVTRETKVAYLRLHPATARAIAREAGIPVGLRGRIKAETFEAVAKTL